MGQRNARSFDGLHQVKQTLHCVQIRLRISDLRADVAVDTYHLESWQAGGMPVSRQHIGVGDAELVAGQPGGDIRMRFGVHVGIDADTHGSLPA